MSTNRTWPRAVGPALAALSAIFLGAWAPAVLAAPGLVVHTVHLRAGPSTEYPGICGAASRNTAGSVRV